MFFCDSCAEKHGWPVSLMTSWGKCEVCRNAAACNDIPSRLLPPAGMEDGE